jgi:hypothetical protein
MATEFLLTRLPWIPMMENFYILVESLVIDVMLPQIRLLGNQSDRRFLRALVVIRYYELYLMLAALAVSRDSAKLYMGGVDGAFYVADLPNGNFFSRLLTISGTPIQVGQSSLCPNCGKFYISSISVHPQIADRIFLTISSFGDPHLVRNLFNLKLNLIVAIR